MKKKSGGGGGRRFSNVAYAPLGGGDDAAGEEPFELEENYTSPFEEPRRRELHKPGGGGGSVLQRLAAKKKKALVGLFLVVFFLVVFVVLAIVLGAVVIPNAKSDSSSSSDHGKEDRKWSYKDVTTEAFTVGPILILPGQTNDSMWHPLPKPSGDIAIRAIKFSLVDADNQTVPLSVAYHQHLLLAKRRTDIAGAQGQLFAGVGPANAKRMAIELDEPFGIPSRSDEEWALRYSVLNLWGAAAQASISIWVRYEICYTPLSAVGIDDHDYPLLPVQWQLLNDNRGTGQNISSTRDPTVKKVEETFDTNSEEDCTIVYAHGFSGLGVMNTTLYNANGLSRADQEHIADITPVYEEGFITDMGTNATVRYNLPDWSKLRLQSFYTSNIDAPSQGMGIYLQCPSSGGY